jgi:tRNA A22 N-methylase
MSTNKQIFVSQHFMAIEIAKIFEPEKQRKLAAMRENDTILPSPHLIYEKEIVIQKRNQKFLSTKFSQIPNNKKKFNLKSRTSSRFDFVFSTSCQEDGVEIPEFVSNLIAKRLLNSKDDCDICCDYSLLAKELNENNIWARYIVSNLENNNIKIGIEKLAQNEQKKLLNKFKSA